MQQEQLPDIWCFPYQGKYNKLIRGDFHDNVIIALESTTANGVGVDEIPKVGVSESSDFISNKLLDKFIHMDTPYSVFSLV